MAGTTERTDAGRATYAAAQRRRDLIAGLVALAVIAVVLVVMFTANQGHLPAAPTTTVRAAFANLGQTDTNSEVRRGGVRIGQVAAVEVQDGRAVATLVLDGTVDVHADATAVIRDQSALAQKYVEFSPGTPGAPPLSGVIPVERTESSQDLPELLGVFDPATRAALRTTLGEVGAGVAGRGPALSRFSAAAPGLLGDTGTVAGALADPRADLPGMLRSGASLAGHVDPVSGELRELLAQTRDTLAAVSVDGEGDDGRSTPIGERSSTLTTDGSDDPGDRPLGRTVAGAADTLPALRAAADALHDPLADTHAAMRDLGPGAAALGDATPNLRGVLREAVGPLEKVPDVADQADPAFADLTTTLAALRPFVPRLDDALCHAVAPLSVLSRYRSDVALFAQGFSKLNASHVGFRHQFRIFLGAPGPGSLAGFGDVPTNPYPAAGKASLDRPGTPPFAADPARWPVTGRCTR